MKRTDLIRRIETLACSLVRHGGKHDWYRNPKTGDVATRAPSQGSKRNLRQAHSEEGHRLTAVQPSANLNRRMSTVGALQSPATKDSINAG